MLKNSTEKEKLGLNDLKDLKNACVEDKNELEGEKKNVSGIIDEMTTKREVGIQEKLDLVVIGSGPGGYVAAIRAAQLGLKVAVVEKDSLGGICLNWGCIPTKALLKSAEVLDEIRHSQDFGIEIAGNITPNITAIVNRSRTVAHTLSNGISGLLKKHKIMVVKGVGKILDKHTVEIQSDKDTKLSAGSIIIATGARPRELKGFESNGQSIWNYKHALVPKEIPESIAIIGAGAIGVEFASFYASMGSKIVILEGANKILPIEDNDTSNFVHKALTKRGIIIHTKMRLEHCMSHQKNIAISFVDNQEKKINIEVEKIISAVGVIPNTVDISNIDLKKDQRDCFVVNDFCQTNVDNIYAIGDVVQGPWLAHKASHEGMIAAEHIASVGKKYDIGKIHTLQREMIPSCVYCKPNIASIGLTEERAKELFPSKVKVGKFSYVGNGKALATGDTDGFVKTIFHAETGELLGAHIVGQEATELIQGFVIGKTAELVEQDFINTVFPHPTVSEAMHESVLAAFDRTIHL